MRTLVNYKRSILLFCGFSLVASYPLASQTPQRAKELLSMFYVASGGDHWRPLAEAEIAGKLNLGGATGTFHQVVDLKLGRDATDIHAGPLKVKQVTLTDSSWQADGSGLVTYSDTPATRVDSINQSFVDRNGWFTAKESELKYAGTQEEHGTRYDLVTVTPAGGRAMTLWLNAQDHLLDRIIQQDSAHHQSTTFFSDYRKTDGVLVPFVVRQSNGDTSQDTIETVETFRFLPSIRQDVFLAPPSKFNDAHLLGKQSSVLVPFTIDDGRIVVDVSVNGHAAVPFLVDTGGGNYMTPQAAKLLGIEGSGNVAISGSGAGQEDGQFAMVKELRVGEVQMLNQQFVLGPLPEMLENRGKEPPIAGLVGAELLRRFPATFDYQKKTLTFYRSGSVPPRQSGARALRLFFDGSHPYIQVRVDGVMGIFGIDTGDSSSTTIFGPFYREHEFPIELPAQVRSQGGIGGLGAALLTRVGQLSFADWKLSQPLVTLNFAQQGLFSNDSIAGNLGHEVLKNFVFTLDYEHRVGYFMPSTEFGVPADYNRSGMALDRAHGGSVLVMRVNPNTPAEEAGIQVGDAVVWMNGMTTSDHPLSTFDRMLSAKAGTEIEMRYARKGKEKRATFHLRELLPPNGEMKPYMQNTSNK